MVHSLSSCDFLLDLFSLHSANSAFMPISGTFWCHEKEWKNYWNSFAWELAVWNRKPEQFLKTRRTFCTLILHIFCVTPEYRIQMAFKLRVQMRLMYGNHVSKSADLLTLFSLEFHLITIITALANVFA